MMLLADINIIFYQLQYESKVHLTFMLYLDFKQIIITVLKCLKTEIKVLLSLWSPRNWIHFSKIITQKLVFYIC